MKDQPAEFKIAQLQILQALARSQAAVASIIEQSAVIAGKYQIPVSLLHEQLRSLADYQSTMISQLSGISMKKLKQGKTTAKPWLHVPVQLNNRDWKKYNE